MLRHCFFLVNLKSWWKIKLFSVAFVTLQNSSQQHQKAERFSISAPLSTTGPFTAARTASCIVSLMRIFSLAELSMNLFAWILRASSSPSSTEINGLRGFCLRSDLVAGNRRKLESSVNCFRLIIDFLLIAYRRAQPGSAKYQLPWAPASISEGC